MGRAQHDFPQDANCVFPSTGNITFRSKKVTSQLNTTQQLIYVVEKPELLIKNELKNNIVVDVLTVHKYAHSLHSCGGGFFLGGEKSWSKPGL